MANSQNPDAIEIISKVLAKHFGVHKSTILTKVKYGHYALNAQNSCGETQDKKGNQTLWPFQVEPEFQSVFSSNPIYFSLNVKLKENDAIDELNIKLFKSDFGGTSSPQFISTELLLRVEWSNAIQDKEVQHIHAQPHWHIHSYKNVEGLSALSGNQRQIFQELLNETVGQQSPSQLFDDLKDETHEVISTGHSSIIKNEFPVYKFHLSMLADWHKETGNPNNTILTNEMLEKWLPQCLNYIKEQVEHVYERMKSP